MYTMDSLRYRLEHYVKFNPSSFALSTVFPQASIASLFNAQSSRCASLPTYSCALKPLPAMVALRFARFDRSSTGYCGFVAPVNKHMIAT